MKNKKVATITLPFSANYGWILQAYALQKALAILGFDTVLLERNWDKTTNKGFVYNIKRFIYYNFLVSKIYRFYKNNLKHTPRFTDKHSLSTYCNAEKFDAVIVGSDQVWRIENTRGVGFNFFLDFVDPNTTKRISYAASFGNDKWKGTIEETQFIRDLLQSFSCISVREEQGIKMCEDLFDVEAKLCIDPTLLLDSSIYENFTSKKYVSDKTISTYILDADIKKDDFVNKIADRAGRLKIKKLYKINKSPIYRYLSVEDWLSSIRHSEYVIVDSFHGMVFSIIFQKQFLVIENKKRGSVRFTTLLGLLGLTDRLISDVESESIDKIFEPINYHEVNKRLCELRKEGMAFLVDSICN